MYDASPAPLMPFWESAIKSKKVKSLSDWDYRATKKSDTVFILGSGPSVNLLSERDFSFISRHDSIGFNMWPLHWFVPNFYESEAPDDFGILYSTWAEKAEQYKDVPFIVFDCHKEIIDLTRVPAEMVKNMYVARTHFLTARIEEKSAYSDSLSAMVDMGFFADKGKISCVCRKRSSGVFNLSLAIQMGYKKIILIGYDLKNHDYFHEKTELKNLEKVYSAQDSASGIPASIIIEAFNDVVCKRLGIELFVGSKQTALYPYLKVFDWGNNGKL